MCTCAHRKTRIPGKVKWREIVGWQLENHTHDKWVEVTVIECKVNWFVSVCTQQGVACYILSWHSYLSPICYTAMPGWGVGGGEWHKPCKNDRLCKYVSELWRVFVCVCVSSTESHKWPQWGVWGSNEITFIRLVHSIVSLLGGYLEEKWKSAPLHI